jgi:hypothetical protein
MQPKEYQWIAERQASAETKKSADPKKAPAPMIASKYITRVLFMIASALQCDSHSSGIGCKPGYDDRILMNGRRRATNGVRS